MTEKLFDLRGVKCPMNFVKLKLAMTSLKEGEEFYAQLDDGEPIDNVPHSLTMEGHEILQQTMEEDGWKLKIKKGLSNDRKSNRT